MKLPVLDKGLGIFDLTVILDEINQRIEELRKENKTMPKNETEVIRQIEVFARERELDNVRMLLVGDIKKLTTCKPKVFGGNCT